MVPTGRNPQKRNKTSKLGGLKEETNTMIFKVNIYGRKSHTGFNQNKFLPKALHEFNSLVTLVSHNILWTASSHSRKVGRVGWGFLVCFSVCFRGRGVVVFLLHPNSYAGTWMPQVQHYKTPTDVMLLGTRLTMHLRPHSRLQLNETSMTQDCTQILKSFSAVFLCSVSQHSRE